ncbi:hypothetical protein ABGB12_21450 [Actinocorallia sp. B10E7]|uniref:hypothetical protein n=1 Tax=Actinocorallia sp. B10E7 TaxID=3153558 RepID=UPI00325D2156
MAAEYYSDMSPGRRAWEAIGAPLVVGAVCGLALGVASWLYYTGVVISVIGGLLVGSQHRALKGAVARGLVGGALWGVALLIVHALTDRQATARLPDPQVIYLIFTILPGGLLAGVSFLLFRRRAS